MEGREIMSTDINTGIDSDELNGWLSQYRPKRYHPTQDKAWMENVTKKVMAKIPAAKAVRISAEKIVRDAENKATRKGNDLFRLSLELGGLPLDPAGDLPVAVKPKKERVQLRWLTPSDLRQFANNERRAASHDFTVRNASCDGAEMLADMMEEKEFSFVNEWIEAIEKGTEQAATG